MKKQEEFVNLDKEEKEFLMYNCACNTEEHTRRTSANIQALMWLALVTTAISLGTILLLTKDL